MMPLQEGCVPFRQERQLTARPRFPLRKSTLSWSDARWSRGGMYTKDQDTVQTSSRDWVQQVAAYK